MQRYYNGVINRLPGEATMLKWLTHGGSILDLVEKLPRMFKLFRRWIHSAPSAQLVRWTPYDKRGPGMLARYEDGMETFIPWDTLRPELEQKLLVHAFGTTTAKS
jgi:hypothetical protein